MKQISTFLLLLSTFVLNAQQYAGTVFNAQTKKPVAFVNIGVVGQNLGTVANEDGTFTIDLNEQFDNDSLRFSCIGYNPVSVKVADYKQQNKNAVYLYEASIKIAEVVIKPRRYKEKVLGIKAKSGRISAGFEENKLGYELGVLMKAKKSARLKSVHINLARCTYDSIFYRLNVYQQTGEYQFENILQEPIYIKLPKEAGKNGIHIDLTPYKIVTQGNFLVSLEHIKNLGDGLLYLSAGFSAKTYYRKTSQADWQAVAVGVGINVVADVEL